MPKTATETASQAVAENVSENVENVEGPIADQPESTTGGKRKDTRQPIEVSAPVGFVKGAAVVYHFAESVPAEVQQAILDEIETSLAAGVEKHGLKLAANLKTYHSVIRIGSEADLAKPVKQVSRKRDEPKVLSLETAETFLNAAKACTSKLIKDGAFDKANRPAAKREAMRLTLLDWNTTKEAAMPILAAYQESLLG